MPASWWGRRAQMERARPSRCLRRPPCPPRSALEPTVLLVVPARPSRWARSRLTARSTSRSAPSTCSSPVPAPSPSTVAASPACPPGTCAWASSGGSCWPGAPAHDRVWAHLRGRARREGGAWVLACAGIAMPGLKARATALACGWVGDPVDLDRELLTGFLEGVVNADPILTPLVPRGLWYSSGQSWVGVDRSARPGGREVAPLLQPCLGDRPSARVSPGARPGSPVTLPAPGASCWLRLAESATATAISWPTEPLLGMGTPNAGRQPRPGPAPVTPSSTRAARRTSCARRCA